MLTALDIQNKEFAKGLRGYNEEEVDAFLDEVIMDYQTLVNRNAELEGQIAELQEKLKGFKDTEGSVLKTLESAKGLMKDIAASAEKRANILLENAQMEAKEIVAKSESNVRLLKDEERQIHIRIDSLKSNYRRMLENELDMLETIDKDYFGE